MKLPAIVSHRWAPLAVVLTNALSVPTNAAPNFRRNSAAEAKDGNPFAVIDPQHWVNPDNMTWADWKTPPGTNWADSSKKGSNRNFNIALVVVDYPDATFVITKSHGSTIFGNPQVSAPSNITREQVPAFYRDFYNLPGELNRGHTLHEYWMGDSGGRYGVDLTSFGAYQLPSNSYQYGISNDMNPGECVVGQRCNLNIRTDALNAWRAEVGAAVAASFELVFILSAGQDESSTWQEFGEMKFQTREDVPPEFAAPPPGTTPASGTNVTRNWAKTRYVEWSSWAASASLWPNAGGGSSTQGESSGMGTYAHELTHLLNIGDNYNNPYAVPVRRAFSGPFSMMDRGSFNGPAGPHTRWQIPPQQGGAMGSLHTMRDKVQIGLVGNESIVYLSRQALPFSGLAVVDLTARAIFSGLMGVRVAMNADLSPFCNVTTQIQCDGGGYNSYDIEVVDRMGADSFTTDSGVLLSKSKPSFGTYQWVIDANPQDIGLLDFHRPDGSPVYATLGDYRQLADAPFHAGTRSGSQYEYVDVANNLHFYIIDAHRDTDGVLSYTTAIRAVNATSPHKHKASLSWGRATPGINKPLRQGVTCSFDLKNTGSYSAAAGNATHPMDVTSYLKSDVYRLSATVLGKGWKVELPNALSAVGFGKEKTVGVAVAAALDASLIATVKLTVTSESDPRVATSAICLVGKYLNL